MSTLSQSLRSLSLEESVSNGFFHACVNDIYKVGMGVDVAHSVITVEGSVLIKAGEENIERFIEANPSFDDMLVREKAAFVKESLLGRCSSMRFSCESMDSNHGTEKAIGRYHDPENEPANHSQRWQRIGEIAGTGVLAGVAPGVSGTLVTALPWVASDIMANALIQGGIWGSGAITGLGAVLYLGHKAVTNPQKRYSRERVLLGNEMIIHDNAHLDADEESVKPSPGIFSGREVSYRLCAPKGKA